MHNIEYGVYEENVNKSDIERKWQVYARNNGDGLYGHIRWINMVFDSENKAREYIEKVDRGDYDQLAVKFREYPSDVYKSAKLDALNNKLQETSKKYRELSNTVHYKNVKSQFVSCPNCSSKLNREFITRNNCPMCNVDMRPKSVLDKINSYQSNINAIKRDIADLKEQLETKALKKARVMWFVKVEYHS